MPKISETDDGCIVLIVKDQHKHELYFKMKRDVPLKKVFVAFCKRTNVVYRGVTFLFDGSRIQPNQTPNQLNMENLDEIDAMSSMSGGSYE